MRTRKAIVFLFFAILGLLALAEETCPAGEACSNKKPQDDEEASIMLQRKAGVVDALTPKNKARAYHKYKPYRVRPLMEYFRWWSKGAIERRSRLDAILWAKERKASGGSPGGESGEDHIPTTKDLMGLMDRHRTNRCPGALIDVKDDWRIVDNVKPNKEGIRHVLLRGPHAKKAAVQYLAVFEGGTKRHIIASDPDICLKSEKKNTQMFLQTGQSSTDPDPTDLTPTESTTGSSDPLSNDDPIVEDCTALFHRTAMENCGHDITGEVLSAELQTIDGFEAAMQFMVTSGETEHIQTVHCDFETPHTDDANLIQKLAERDRTDSNDLPEEDLGLTATLRMLVNICESETTDTANTDLLEHHKQGRFSFGELSLYKGYEHVNDGITKFKPSMLALRDAPPSYDITDEYPNCFLNNKMEAVRDQGSCGSCWAFAGNSATMNTLCTSAAGYEEDLSHADETDRFEISVQTVMSCKCEP